ncbi:MAG: hypothetical protein WDN09_00770 [bacterium]
MSKRNFKILIIVLLILALIAFLYFYFYKKPAGPAGTGDDANSYSGFGNGGGKNNGSDNNSPTDISGTGGTGTNQPVPKLRKVSSMPVAGFGIFTKERFKEVPAAAPASDPAPAATTSPSASATDMDADYAGDAEGSGTYTPVTPPKSSAPATSPAPLKPAAKTTAKSPSAPTTEFVTAVRYAARATGNIYQTFADTLNEQKFSSTIIPKIYDAYFDSKAESVVMRYLKNDQETIETFAGVLPKELLAGDTTGNNELKGSFLGEGITDISMSADLQKIFYLIDISDTATGVTSGYLGDKKTEVFNSPFTEWLSQWPNANMVTITTKPASGYPGYMYWFDPAKQDLQQVLGNINGLTDLTSPDGKIVLYSNDQLGLSLYNVASKNVIPVGLRTMPEKCVWTKASTALYCFVPKTLIPNNQYPDDWYKGKISFSDQIWSMNALDGTVSLVADPISFPGGEEIDGTKPALDKDGRYLFFVNKKDSFLWEFDLQ